MNRIKTALISVFHKKRLGPVLDELRKPDVHIFSTSGIQKFIEQQGLQVIAVAQPGGYIRTQ